MKKRAWPELDGGSCYAVRVISAIDRTYNGVRVNDHMQAMEGVGWIQGYAWTSGSIAVKHILEAAAK